MFKVYSSSAGSGKTYTLTKEYLKLALSSESETYFRSILAVTFTNAAANEMKDRILTMLRVFSSAEKETPPMLLDIVAELYPGIESTPEVLAETVALYRLRARRVFRKILHRYSDFSVMTIDKFTQRLVSSFTDELGIPFGFETQVDSDQLSNAVDRMLARIGQEGEAVLTDVVETYYRESAEDGKSWGSLPHRIREAAYDLLDEKSYLSMLKVADLEVQDWVGISRQIKAFVRETEYSIHQQAKKAMAMIEARNLVAKDFTQGNSGIFGYFTKRSNGQDLWVEANAHVLSAVNEDRWCSAKTPAFIQEEVRSLAPSLITIYREIEGVLEQQAGKASLLRLLDKHLYNLSLLGEIRTEFDALMRQKNQVHISDFNRKVLEIVAKEPVPFIFERLGEKYNHILVDEFQDTSKLQFANLLPLIDNALGFGHFNLVVGDAKQSIYRFRGGDMDLIMHLSQNQVGSLAEVLGDSAFTRERLQSLDRELQVAHLRTNRRSYREITEFNNGFFSSVAESISEEHGMVGSVFDENFQQEMPPGVQSNGHVQIEFLTEPENSGTDDSSSEVPEIMVLRTLELIEELRTQGYHWRDMAILCRKKSEATAIAGALKERGTPLISDDSLLLTYSKTVNLIVAFMQVLQTPDHALSRYEAAYLFHRTILKKIPDALQHEQMRLMCLRRDTISFLQYFEAFGMEFSAFRLRQLGVYELSEKLIATFQLFDGLSEGPYLFRFLDAILDFGTRNSNHLADFLAYWENAKTKISITVPADSDALRITTIHKSKGLEYPVVLIPNCDWSYTPRGNRDRIWVDLQNIEEEELRTEEVLEDVENRIRKLNSSVVSMVKELGQTSLQGEYEEEKTRTLLENLNLLYVAFTRPIQRLYILAKEPKNWEKCNDSVNRWLYDYLNGDASPCTWTPGQSVYVVSDGDTECFHHRANASLTRHPIKHLISVDRTDRLRLRRMAERIFDVETFEKKKDHLQKMRYALSLIGNRADVPQVLRKMAIEGIVESAEATQLQHSLRELLEKESIAELFESTTQVRLQKDILLPQGKIVVADRLIRLPSGHEIVMNVVAGSGNDGARRRLRNVLKAYQEMHPSPCRGVLLTLEDRQVEWFD